jgi:hypothetical protein
VWVVDATLKKGMRHINSAAPSTSTKTAGRSSSIDHYDGQRPLWRYSEAPSINYYEVPMYWTTLETHHDLKSGRYISSGLLDNEEKSTSSTSRCRTAPDKFSPQALRRPRRPLKR